mmetsp:Transcript_24277/g.63958  ORF Transcript_24277/g.63958 Transcript_24277/m.63958 type:complete len:328 (+) Transcript_24277:47-1030(+)
MAGATVATAVLAATSAALPSAPELPAVCPPGFQRWRLHLAYDGTDFFGWQRQAGPGSGDGQTIQGEVEECLTRVFRAEVRTVGASRTDRGVHARGQVCHFDAPEFWGPQQAPGLEPEIALRRLRRELPGSVLAVVLDRAAPDFHARLSAVRKRYSYRLATVDAVSPFEARFVWCPGALDLQAMAEAAEVLDRRKLDYSTFSMGEPEPDYHGDVEKNVTLAVREDGPDRALVLVSCDRFLYKMVRRIVGALAEVGKGRLRPEGLDGVHRTAVPTAPPHGLCLDAVEYPAAFPAPEVRLTNPKVYKEIAAERGLPKIPSCKDLSPPPWP